MKRCLFLLIILTLGFAETILIPEDYATIQEGIDASVDGDTVLVADGDYVENLVLDKSIVLTSYAIYDNLDEWIIFDDYYLNQWDINNSHIENTRLIGSSPDDPDYGSVILITPDSEECISPEIVGFTIQGGSGTRVLRDGNPVVLGGGILADISDPHIHHNAFENNGSEEVYSGGASSLKSSAEDWSFDNRFENYNPRCEVEEFRLSDNLYNGNDAQYGNTMANRFHEDEFDMSGSIFDVFDCGNEESAVSTIWVKVEPAASVDYDDGAGQLCAFTAPDVYVDSSIPQECLDEGCGFQNNPFKTIARTFEMINPTLNNPITIHLAAGTYSPQTGEIFPINMLSNVNIEGEDEETTILDAMQTSEECEEHESLFTNQCGGVIKMEDCQNNIIFKITITGGYANYGGGLNIYRSDPILTNMIIHNNTATGEGANYSTSYYGGGGIFLLDSNPIIVNVIISENSAIIGGGIEIQDSNPILGNITIIENNTEDINDIWGGNESGSGAGIYIGSGSKAFLDHVIVSDNFASSFGGGIVVTGEGSVSLVNSIIWSNEPESIIGLESSDSDDNIYTSEIITSYSNIDNMNCFECSINIDGGEGTINSDPLFNNPSNNDYTLQDGSPCINQGDPNLWYIDVDGTVSDMGVTGGQFVMPNFTNYDFGEVGIIAISTQFTLFNYRETAITINNVSFGSESFISNTSFPITIEPLQTGIINIEANNSSFEYVEDSMQIVSGDLPEGVSISLSVNGTEDNVLTGNLSGTYPVDSYRITGDLTIQSTDTVFLQAGTKFLFDGEYEFIVNGMLSAVGTEVDSIIFDNFNSENCENYNENECNQIEDCYYDSEHDNICLPIRWEGISFEGSEGDFFETYLQYIRISGSDNRGLSLNTYYDFTLDNAIISGNFGGGISLEDADPIFTHIMITGNSAGEGAGIYLSESNPILNDVIISDNFAEESAGGISMEMYSNPSMTNVVISGNTSMESPGGMRIRMFSNPEFINLEVSGNSLVYSWNIDSNIPVSAIEISWDSEPIFTNTSITNNQIVGSIVGSAAAMYINMQSNPIFTNLTMSGNPVDEGGGIILGFNGWETGASNLTIYNSIIWDNGPETIIIYENDNYEIKYSNIDNWVEGVGNISTDPLFTDPENGDYTLQENSPCIDAGTADIDGDGVDDITDFIGSAPDMGAYESGESSEIMYGDTNFDGVVDILDIILGISIILGNTDSTNEQLNVLDMNQDGDVNVIDIVEMINYILRF